MPVHNADIAAIFDEIADLLDIRGDNPFRIRAYRKAARTVAGFGHEFTSLFEAGSTPPKLPGIGVDLAAKIREIATSGHCAMLDGLRQQVPPAITELLKIPGLGPRRVQTLHSELGIASIAQLRQAAQSGQLRQIAGFGPKTEQGLLKALQLHQLHNGQSKLERRFLRPVAGQYALSLLEYLKAEPGIAQLIVAGSYRRLRETVGDLDILATAASTSKLMQRLLAYDEVQTVLAHGETRSSVVLRSGLQVDLRLVQPECYGAALHYFTGSKAHNIAMRHLARARGLKLNEYGVFRGSQRIAGDTEASVFAAVGLPYIAPELREDRGEIEAARDGRLPQLISRSDLRGDLHAHSTASDGKHSIEQMAAAAQALGLEYMAITDHSQRLTVARGLNPAQLERQIEQIDRINHISRINAELASGSGLTILKGSEVDILEDGTLDLPDEILQRLDLVIVALHSKFNLPRQRQTERILKALEHPYVDLLAHPGGRLLGQRDPIDIDFPAVLRKAKSRQIFLELNSQPDRLDLDELCCKMARDEGVLISINSDAHSNAGFVNLDYGIAQARRGWLAPADVLNTRSLAELRSLLKSGRTVRTG
jgi:DNA polymerase (family 10)